MPVMLFFAFPSTINMPTTFQSTKHLPFEQLEKYPDSTSGTTYQYYSRSATTYPDSPNAPIYPESPNAPKHPDSPSAPTGKSKR